MTLQQRSQSAPYKGLLRPVAVVVFFLMLFSLSNSCFAGGSHYDGESSLDAHQQACIESTARMQQLETIEDFALKITVAFIALFLLDVVKNYEVFQSSLSGNPITRIIALQLYPLFLGAKVVLGLAFSALLTKRSDSSILVSFLAISTLPLWQYILSSIVGFDVYPLKAFSLRGYIYLHLFSCIAEAYLRPLGIAVSIERLVRPGVIKVFSLITNYFGYTSLFLQYFFSPINYGLTLAGCSFSFEAMISCKIVHFCEDAIYISLGILLLALVKKSYQLLESKYMHSQGSQEGNDLSCGDDLEKCHIDSNTTPEASIPTLHVNPHTNEVLRVIKKIKKNGYLCGSHS